MPDGRIVSEAPSSSQPERPRLDGQTNRIDAAVLHLTSESQGRPLGIVDRVRLEPFFPDLNLADVRVHTDEPADRSAQSLRADAFSLGRHLFFRAGRFDVTTAKGLALIGHELSHTRQIGDGRPFASPSDRGPLEAEAASVEATILRVFSLTGPAAAVPGVPPTGPQHRFGRLTLEPARRFGASPTGDAIAAPARTPSTSPPPAPGRDSGRGHPLKADEARSAAAGPGSAAPSSRSDEPDEASRALFRTLVRRIRTEKERRGVDLWVP